MFLLGDRCVTCKLILGVGKLVMILLWCFDAHRKSAAVRAKLELGSDVPLFSQ